MEPRTDAYKQRGRSGQDRSTRAQVAQAEQKSRRQDMVTKRRPVAQIQEDENKVPKKPVVASKKAQQHQWLTEFNKQWQKRRRLQSKRKSQQELLHRLKEWKKKKKERKRVEAMKRRPPFVAGGVLTFQRDRLNPGGRQPKSTDKQAAPTGIRPPKSTAPEHDGANSNGRRTPYTFTFRKSLSATPNSLLQEGKNKKSVECHVDPILPPTESLGESQMHMEMVPDALDERDQVTIETEEAQKKAGIAVPYLYGLRTNVTDQLTSLCDLWDEKSNKLESEQVDGNEVITADVLGQVRTTIGQGRLLMEDVEFLKEALQGFWDKVYFQVEDVLAKFKHLDELEGNNWQEVVTKKPKTSSTGWTQEERVTV